MEQIVIKQEKTTKVTKVRRSRQPRNAQLSVARRNERERNRVKMVNNGFALLREHLPAEDLRACEQQSGSETPDSSGGGGGGQQGNNKLSAGKAKKFSKVETLRAAIQRIKMLEELIRSTEPDFESINLNSHMNQQQQQIQMMAAAYDDEPLSVQEPLSCGSSSQSASLVHSTDTYSQHQHQHQQQQHLSPALTTVSTAVYNTNYNAGHFVKLEPQIEPSSPAKHSQTSTNHTNSLTQHYQPAEQEVPSHTYTWIQQHQSSFMEQQQQYQQQQQQQQFEPDWYAQQQQQQKATWFAQPQTQQQGQESEQQQQQQQQQQHSPLMQQLSVPQIQQQQVLDSPIWFGGRSSSNSDGSPPISQMAQTPQSVVSQPIMSSAASFHHQAQHQISLYSQ